MMNKDHNDSGNNDNDNDSGNNDNVIDSDNDNDSSVHIAVQDVLDQLVKHFRQNIHSDLENSFVFRPTGNDRLNIDSSIIDNESFVGPEIRLSTIVRYWLNQLWSPTENYSLVEILLIVSEWIQGYETSIRPFVFNTTHHSAGFTVIPQFDPGCLHILTNYEIMLSEMILKLLACIDNDMNSDKNNHDSNRNTSLSLKRRFSRAVNVLSTDVTLLTSNTLDGNCRNNEQGVNKKSISNSNSNIKNNNNNNNLRKNIALPTLLKILSNTLTSLHQVCLLFDTKTINRISDNNKVTNNSTFDNANNSLPKYYDCLRRCAVTLLAFNYGTNNENGNNKDDKSATLLNVISPHHIAPSLSMSLSLMTPSSGTFRNDGLDIVRRMIKHSQEVRRRTYPSGSEDSDDELRYRYYLDGIGSYKGDIDDNYWNSNSESYFLTTDWIDPDNTKLISQLVDDIWSRMASLLLNRQVEVEYVIDDDIHVIIPQQRYQRRKSVLKILGGAVQLLQNVRAHFFGRDMHGVEKLMQQKQERKKGEESILASSVVVRMGRRVIKTTKNDNTSSPNDESPYIMIPSRIAVAVNALRILLAPDMILLEQHYQDDVDTLYGYRKVRNKILEDVFPICASLLDSSNITIVILGAAGFLLAIDALQSHFEDTVHEVGDGGEIVEGNNDDTDAWVNFMENTLSVLERAFQTSADHGPVVITIGRAQSRLFEIMLQHKVKYRGKNCSNEDYDNRFRRRRRIVTGHWLTRLERSSYRPTTENQCLELLLGGIIPLLSQHSTDGKNQADAIEVGRLGLAALLPLTTMTTTDAMGQLWGDETTRKTQIASMVALISLMLAAHPIMPCHGGKIMSNLLAAATTNTPTTANNNKSWPEEKSVHERLEFTNDSEGNNGNSPKTPNTESIRSMAVLTAAIALNICGPKFAGELLHSIRNDRERYQQNLLNVVSEVHRVAGDMMVR